MAKAKSRRSEGDGSNRVHRRRAQSSSNGPLIIGVAAVALIGIGLFVAASSGEPPRQAPKASAPKPDATADAPVPAPVAFTPKAPESPKDEANLFVQTCKMQARGGKDPDGAIAKLKGALGKWGGKYDAELYFTMGIAMGEKGETQSVWQQKYEYYKKCKEALDAGGSFTYDPLGNRKPNFSTILNVAKDKAGL